MTRRLFATLLLALACVLPTFAAAQTSVSLAPDKPQTQYSVNLVYRNLPQNTVVRFVNTTSGNKLAPYTLRIGGTGTLSLPKYPYITSAGDYYVLAETTAGVLVARTVNFTTEPGVEAPPSPE